MSSIIDLSQYIESNMPVYPGDIETSLFQTNYLDLHSHNNFRLNISMHSGTHIDSPMHLTESTEHICEKSLESFVGIGCVLDVRNEEFITMKEEYMDLIKENSIVLLYTGWDKLYGTKEYYDNHPCVSLELCEFLLKRNIKILGMDTPSPDNYPFPVHKMLLENDRYILENLRNLDKLLGVPNFEVIALPLKLRADSSMTRAIARLLE